MLTLEYTGDLSFGGISCVPCLGARVLAPEANCVRTSIECLTASQRKAKTGWRKTSLTAVARKLLKRQAMLGRLGIAAINEAVTICGKSGLLSASIPPDLVTQIKQPFALRAPSRPTSASVGRPSNSSRLVLCCGFIPFARPACAQVEPRTWRIATRLIGLRRVLKRSCGQEGLQLNQSEKQRRPK